MVSKWVIVVGGGSGTRMGTEIPKQFLLLHNKPVIIHTIQQFQNSISEIKIVVVLPKVYQQTFFDMAKKFNLKDIITVHGGDSRFQSVKNGLNEINAANEDIIAVHDAVRPLVSEEFLIKMFKEAEGADAIIPVIDVKESIRKIEGEGSEAIDRAAIKIVQTPQVFNAGILKKAYLQKENKLFTDDASVVEQDGVKIKLTEGEEENIKITHPADMNFAEMILRKRNTNQAY